MGPTANTLDLQAADVAATDLALSPILFSNSVQNAAAAYISMLLKIRGPSLSINQYEMAVPLAFQTAIDWLEEGRTETVLVGSIDCFSKALHEETLRCGGTGAVPIGEGSAFFVLTAAGSAGGAHPVVEAVRTGGPGRADAQPVEDALVLRNGVRAPGADCRGRCASPASTGASRPAWAWTSPRPCSCCARGGCRGLPGPQPVAGTGCAV